jgi:hypothetical protein
VRDRVTDEEEGVAPVCSGRGAAALAVLCLALFLPALPIAAATGLVPEGATPLAAGAAILAVGLGGGKLAAAIVAAASRA